MENISISGEVQSVQDGAVETRRTIHQNPELGFEEEQTSSLVTEKLDKWGIPYESGIAETGVVGLLEGEGEGPTVLLRADMDALPIHEENDIPYRSKKDGVMHACGHDGHTSILLYTARVLAEERDQLDGNVKFIFQPAEEGPGGAKPMIEEGVLEDPDVEAAFGLHLWNPFPTGELAVQPGPLMACADRFEVTVHGDGGHGARPHETRDPVVCSAQMISNLQSIVSRETNPVGTSVVSVGQIQGGSRFNIIPDDVTFEGTVRTFDRDYRTTVSDRIQRICENVAEAHRCEVDVNYVSLYPPTVNDAEMTDFVRNAAENVVEVDQIRQSGCKTLGGEDMSFFLEEVPGCYFFVGAGGDEGRGVPHHSATFNFDERAMSIGMEVFRQIVHRYLN